MFMPSPAPHLQTHTNHIILLNLTKHRAISIIYCDNTTWAPTLLVHSHLFSSTLIWASVYLNPRADNMNSTGILSQDNSANQTSSCTENMTVCMPALASVSRITIFVVLIICGTFLGVYGGLKFGEWWYEPWITGVMEMLKEVPVEHVRAVAEGPPKRPSRSGKGIRNGRSQGSDENVSEGSV